jgi:hypothetical protein
MASVAAALAGSGQLADDHPVSAEAMGTLGEGVVGDGRLMAAAYMAILPDRDGSNPTRAQTDDR